MPTFGLKIFPITKHGATCSTSWSTSWRLHRCGVRKYRGCRSCCPTSNPQRLCCDSVASIIEKGMGMRSIVIFRAAFILGAVLVNAAMTTAFADTVVVGADRMVDVLTGRVIDHPQITITDGRITAVGQDAASPPGARRVDLKGMTLLPGLIDMHTHLTSDPHFSGYRRLQFTDNFWTVVGVASARKTLEAGFTTIRNVGSANFDDVAIKQAIEQGIVPGPRIVPATYAIGATGGHRDATEIPPSGSGARPAWCQRAGGVRGSPGGIGQVPARET